MADHPASVDTDTQGSSGLIAFLDECGNPSLEKIDRDFPVFVLSVVVVRRQDYVETIVPRLAGLKLAYWDHEGVNLHSRDIRKAEGAFSILQHPARRERFLADLSALMEELPFTLFVVGIDKLQHRTRYAGNASNPYDLALTFAFERIVHFMEGCGERDLPVIAEARGSNEDRSLEAAFHKMLAQGTSYVGASRFAQLSCRLVFENKLRNIAGIQLADLCAHPSARYILRPHQESQAYKVVRRHIYQRESVRGWKVFP